MPAMDKLSTYRTNVMVTGRRLSVVYADTLIVDADDNAITLDSNGWQTVTTKRKMNQAANQFGLGYSIWQEKGKWFVRTPQGETLPYADGMTFARVN
jgi:hypothetical protein